jgi:hypothetical protein
VSIECSFVVVDCSCEASLAGTAEALPEGSVEGALVEPTVGVERR